MKLVVLFVVVATFATMRCAETSIGDMEKPNIDDEILRMILPIFCNTNQIDIASIITNKEIMMRFPNKSIQELQQLYCFNESTTVGMQVTNPDANMYTSPSSVEPNTITLPGITTDNTPYELTQVSCNLPLIDPRDCDPVCFFKIKSDINECINNNSRQYLLLYLKYKNDYVRV